MTNVFDDIHDNIEAVFAEEVIFDPSSLAITFQAVVEVEFKSVGGIDRIQIPNMLFISQNELDDKVIALVQDDVVQVRSINYKIAEIEDDGRGGVITSIYKATV